MITLQASVCYSQTFLKHEYLDLKDLHRVSNHPVHIVDEDGKLSPSSFIPFCEFGGNMSAMGVKIDQIDVPVCNSFKAKVLNDQLCYEVDPNLFIDRTNTLKYLKLGLVLVLDYNEDRQTTEFLQEESMQPDKSLTKQENMKVVSAKIHINSLGDFFEI